MKTQFNASDLPIWAWILLALLMLGQSSWIFRDAQKRGLFPWFWGLWGLIQCPTPLVVYYFVVIRRKKNKNIL